METLKLCKKNENKSFVPWVPSGNTNWAMQNIAVTTSITVRRSIALIRKVESWPTGLINFVRKHRPTLTTPGS